MFSDKKIIIIVAPSGSGKTSVAKHLLKTFPEKLSFSVSAATRLPRSNEKDKVDYYFMSVEDFKTKIENNEFAEWEMVYEGKYYGTLNTELERIWANGKIPLLDVDVQGGMNVQKQFGENSLSIFIEPPSIADLKERLLKRGTETPASLEARINKAMYELTFKNNFSITIVNDDLETCCLKAVKVVEEFIG